MSAAFDLLTAYDEFIRAAPDSGLSSSESQLLNTLLSEEDQHHYNQLIKTTLSHNILHILHQVTIYFHNSSIFTHPDSSSFS
jgi:hypothetical protein